MKSGRNWGQLGMKYKLGDVSIINPRETIKKGTIAKKVDMAVLQPFTRKIPSFELLEYKGGTKFRNGDTIMARITPCLENGKTSQVSILDDNEIGFGSTEYIVFRAKEGISDCNFLYYLVCSDIVRDPAIKSMVGSSGRQRVQTDVIQNLEIDLPSFETQKQIASILSALDDKIELNNRINENLEQQAQAIFKSWFVDFEPFGGVMPEDMREVPLNELCEIVTKGTTPTTIGKHFSDKGINFLKAESILQNHSFDRNKFAHIDNDTHKVLKRSIIKEGDIVFTIAGTLGRFALVDNTIIPANTNQAVAIIRANKNVISSEYLYNFFIGNWHNEYYAKRVQQAVQANLSLATIKSLPIFVLSNKDMMRYNDLVTPICKAMKANEYENLCLSALRDTLLPKLMNGEIDVSKVKI